MAMTLERFRALADAWGGDLSRWPEPERDLARMLLARDASAREVLGYAAALDARLAVPVPPPPSGLLEAILARAPTAPEAAPSHVGAAVGRDPALPAAEVGLARAPTAPGAAPSHVGAAVGRDPALPGAEVDLAPAAGSPAGARRAFAANGRSYAGRLPGNGGVERRAEHGRAGGRDAARRLWRELGGLRTAGPALAAALVLGVAMAELRSGMEPAIEADAETLLAEALLAGDYEEFAL